MRVNAAINAYQVPVNPVRTDRSQAAIPASLTPLAPVDRVRLQALPSMQRPANLFQDTLALPKARSQEDYQNIFAWVEKVTGKPIAYQNKASQQAYIDAIKGRPQEYYDTKNFLGKIGVHGTETYGRDDKGVHNLLKNIEYSPNSEEVSWGLRLAQKSFFWVFKTFPKTFDKLADVADKYYFTRKDQKSQSWLNIQVPQPGISPTAPLLPANEVKAHYANTKIAEHYAKGRPLNTEELFKQYFMAAPPQEIGSLFEDDFHMGTPTNGEPPQNYGTFAIATQLGFSEESARHFATANYDMDLNNTAYGDTDAFPNAKPSRHFNLNKLKPEGGDTRFIWAQKHLDAAVELARRGEFVQAERELGYGLHGVQDSFAHGHIRLTSHAITDNIPDGVDYNPVAAYEATQATIGYLNSYLQRLQSL